MRSTLISILLLSSVITLAQNETNIVPIIDNLTIKWDEAAIKLKNYQGIQEFCLTEKYRIETTELLDAIHHWDTTLYFIVRDKFDANQDKEAEATLKDIELLETEYSTQKFKQYISDECGMLKVIQDNFNNDVVKKYEKDIKKFEKELVKYVNSITYRIDIIDEHIHHLDFD